MTLYVTSFHIDDIFEMISRKSMSTKRPKNHQHLIIVHLMAICLFDGRKLERQLKYQFDNETVFVPQIHWELNWSNQRDQRLIGYIRDELLIPPPTCSKNNLNLQNEYDPNNPWKHQRQNGEALVLNTCMDYMKLKTQKVMIF